MATSDSLADEDVSKLPENFGKDDLSLGLKALGICVWWNDEESDTWETGCGNAFVLNEGPPAENKMKFCCFCGKKLEESRG